MASESSNSSSTSQHPDENKQNQLPDSDSNKSSIDFVNLSKDDLDRGSKVQEHNFFSPDQVGSSSSAKFYSCSYCKGQYSSLQALGGHQNAHKAERALHTQQIKQRPLGIRMESMIQKSPYFGPRVGYGALSLHDILNPSLVSFKNNMLGSNSGVASLGIGGGATTSRTEDEVGYTNNGNGAILKIGESSANNLARIEEESSDSESSGLDLSLKL
ncbi:zinc finger protein [Trifolium pratense]|uniref:Zinc finger protein n=1 Tax=Trifolium pratense TaxID=57577 RepID=A0A2K3JRR0_TRIPR|nr:zinc finger protein [Trifolium pratense]